MNLPVDFSNAFSSVDRSAMFKEIRDRIPSMSPWMECCYSTQPILHLSKHSLFSCCGVQQGDPLGPQAFALTLHPIIERIAEELPGLLINVWYLDNGILCDSEEDILKDLNTIEEDVPSMGLHFNRSKSLFPSVNATFVEPLIKHILIPFSMTLQILTPRT